MSEFTPDTAYVRREYAHDSLASDEQVENAKAEFDRWIAEHDRQATSRAYERGIGKARKLLSRAWSEGFTAASWKKLGDHIDNPYAKEES